MIWAERIKALDNFRCAYCGSTENLNACHIKSRSEYPELSENIENGITLCRKCHYALHYGDWDPKRSIRKWAWCEMSVSPDIINQFVSDYDATRIVLSIPKEKFTKIQAHAAARGESVNGFINRAIDNQMERDAKGGDRDADGEGL